MPSHRAKPGDCLSSIAFEHGFFWETLLDHPDNKVLKEPGRGPFILTPGETVAIPQLRAREVAIASGRLHRFRRKGVPARFKLTLVHHDGTPRADEPYLFELDDELLEGDRVTDGAGKIDESIPPNAKRVRVFLDGGEEILSFTLGGLEPASTIRGRQARLLNLSYYRGPIDGKPSPALDEALRRFCEAEQLDETASEEEIQRQLETAYGD